MAEPILRNNDDLVLGVEGLILHFINIQRKENFVLPLLVRSELRGRFLKYLEVVTLITKAPSL